MRRLIRPGGQGRCHTFNRLQRARVLAGSAGDTKRAAAAILATNSARRDVLFKRFVPPHFRVFQLLLCTLSPTLELLLLIPRSLDCLFNSAPGPLSLLHRAIAMADQYQQTKDTASYKTEEAKQEASGLGQTAKDKAGQVGQAGQEKWDQTKQGASDATGATQQKAQEAKDKTGNVLQQAGDKVKEVIGNVTGNNENQ